jgi:hypothetical protein
VIRDAADALLKAIVITFWWYVGMGIRGYVGDGLDACRAREYYSIVHKEDR